MIDVLARVPCDAAKSETFLGLSRKMADTMDSDHVATLTFAHWPSAVSPWYDDLRRIARLSPVLGKFMLLDDYFSHTDMPGRLARIRARRISHAVPETGDHPPAERSDFAIRAGASRAGRVRRRCKPIATLRDLVDRQDRARREPKRPRERPAAEAGEQALSAAVARFGCLLPRGAATVDCTSPATWSSTR